MDIEEKKRRQREATRRYREKLRNEGRRETDSRTPEENRERIKRAREAARKKGKKLATDTWWERNKDKHRARVNRWRKENVEYARAISADAQERRRSTAWGRINNRIWPILHFAVRRNSPRQSYYTIALGYSWAELRTHIEKQFTAEMTWENWGSVWELDHIKPLSSFRYTSLDDPLFKECWCLSNLRPLVRAENQSKGKRNLYD